MNRSMAANYDNIILQYTKRKNIGGDEILEFIDVVVDRYGFCLSNWIRELIENSHKKRKTFADEFYLDETIEERWQKIYRGKISPFQEIVIQARYDKIFSRREARRMLGKIKWSTRILYLNPEKLVGVLENKKELDEILDYWRRVFKPGPQKIM